MFYSSAPLILLVVLALLTDNINGQTATVSYSAVCNSRRICRVFSLVSSKSCLVNNIYFDSFISLNGQSPAGSASLQNSPLTIQLPLNITRSQQQNDGGNPIESLSAKLTLFTTNSFGQTGQTVCSYQSNSGQLVSCSPALAAGSVITVTGIQFRLDGGCFDNQDFASGSILLHEHDASSDCLAVEPAVMVVNSSLPSGNRAQVLVGQWSSGASTTLCNTLVHTITPVITTTTTTITLTTALTTTTLDVSSSVVIIDAPTETAVTSLPPASVVPTSTPVPPPIPIPPTIVPTIAPTPTQTTTNDQPQQGLTMPVLIGVVGGAVGTVALMAGIGYWLIYRRIHPHRFYTSEEDGAKLKQQQQHPSDPSFYDGSRNSLQWSPFNNAIYDSAQTMAMVDGDYGTLPPLHYRYSASANDLLQSSQLAPPMINRAALNPQDQTLMESRAVIALPGFLKADYHSDMRPLKVIAEGGGGVVYEAEFMSEHLRAKYPYHRLVALKLVKNPGTWSFEEMLANFRQEVSVMWTLSKHPNVVKLLAYTEEPMSIVMPYYPFGMMDIIKGEEERRLQILTDDNITRFAYQLASAMSEMHSLDIVHRDLKTPNVLMDAPQGSDPSSWQTVLCDFGLSRPLQAGQVKASVLTDAMGITSRYAAPEVFEKMRQVLASKPSILIDSHSSQLDIQDAEQEKKGDVYAYAIIVWEMFERQTCWPDMNNAEIEEQVVAMNKRPEFKVRSTVSGRVQEELRQIIEHCWQKDHSMRPGFAEILSRLQSLIECIPPPIAMHPRESFCLPPMANAYTWSRTASYGTMASLARQQQLQHARGGYTVGYAHNNQTARLSQQQQEQLQQVMSLQRTRSMRSTLPPSFLSNNKGNK